MNTRKFSRTMNEAFPRTADYGCAIERTRRDFEWTPIRIALCVTYVLALITLGAVL